MTLTLMDWFCGAGGSSQGAHAVPGVTVTRAANHWERAIQSHAANFPAVDHWRGDIREAPVERWPVTDIFWASPECPQWSRANGRRRDFHATMQPDLFGENAVPEEVERSRALMEEVPLYLRGAQERGGLVLAGVVENVVDVRAWDQWDRWLGEIRALGYRTRTIAINSMHAHGTRTPAAPQSRDRLYVAYWHRSLGRDPDWDRWLRPQAWCPACDQVITAIQVFKRPGADMGRYRMQYVYRCPRTTCRNAVVEPGVLPAAAAIDWTLPGQRIGDRDRPLAPKTIGRIEAGLKRYARPLMVPAGGTWRDDATPVTEPMPTRTTRENDGVAIPPFITEPRGGSNVRPVTEPLATIATSGGHHGLAMPPFLVPLRSGRNRSLRADTEPLATVVADGGNHGLAVPPLLVPVEGREGKEASPATEPLRTQTARNETGLAWLPFVAELRGGSSDARPVSEALATVTASGNHHGLVVPPGFVMRNNTPRGDAGHLCTPFDEPVRALTTAGHLSLVTWESLLVPYYGTGTARPVSDPVGTLSTRDRYALVSGIPPVEDVLFRMLEPHEIGRAMAFGREYVVLGNKRERVRQYGNAVTPPVAELIISALAEAITGEPIERAA
ncbi:DNA cytosine methyltransferase [Spongiactinospora sp. TRM90649]|uniref:DNA cytosine methyltransferase n=1 Tax=Spongiactinospora sp. TRM90649 TaxID=3031114 RepID=UPI0023F9EB4D|nr:DNA cytosine methyltransferase [Spongiactinospora sp. TRM90649]MDF5755802.1 DNA cytosine methyltransferase [Spongiactinospora sp. TRM90649]